MTLDVNRPFELLVVDDNEGDIRLVEEAMAETNYPHHVHVADDGAQALAFLRRQAQHEKSPRPDIIFLDLNLPGQHGIHVLEEIKKDTSLRSIPVIILTTSRANEDIVRAYELYANGYVRKPLSLQEFNAAIRTIVDFWLNVAILPARS